MEDKLLELRNRSRGYFNDHPEQWPRTVFVRFRVDDMRALDEVTGTVELDICVYLRWFDPSLINISREHFSRTVPEYEQLWTPSIEVNRSEACEELWDGDTAWNLKDYSTGEVKYSQKYRVKIQNPMDLSCFPFDSDVVAFEIGSKYMGSKKVIFRHDPDFDPSKTQVTLSSTEWSFQGPPAAYHEDQAYSHMKLDVLVHRNYMYYVYKICMINTLSFLWSLIMFFDDPTDLMGRMSTTITLFLASVAFLFVVNDKLPKVSYLTVMDKLILVSFVLLFAVACECLLVYALSSDDHRWFALNRPDLADRIDLLSLLAFPAVYVGSFTYYVCTALHHRRRTRERGLSKVVVAQAPPAPTAAAPPPGSVVISIGGKEKVQPAVVRVAAHGAVV